MEENTSILKQIKHENTEFLPVEEDDGNEKPKRQLFKSENDCNRSPPSSQIVLRSVSDETDSDKLFAEINGEVTEKSLKSCLDAEHNGNFTDNLPEPRPKAAEFDGTFTDNKENTSNEVSPQGSNSLSNNEEEQHKLDQRSDSSNMSIKEQQNSSETLDAEIKTRAQEEGCVTVVFPGTVTQDGCCRFVSEILKCVLYQRQQLPMTYDQLVYSQKKQQASMQDKDTVLRKPALSTDMDWRKCQQTLQDLEEVLQQLEVLFSLSRVPRVLMMMGGSLILPKELYEINMETLVLASGDKSLRVSSCLRQLFRTLFVADLLSDTKPVCLMPTTVLVLAHRDCGVGWFRPKLQFKVPTRVKSKIMTLSSDIYSNKALKRDELKWDDYIWFQAPMAIKGFRNCKT